MKKHLLLQLLLVLAVLPLMGGNSIFSYDGYPVQYFGKDIYSLGMGDTGASDVFRNNTGYANPAMQNLTNRSLFATGIIAGYTKYRSLDAADTYHKYLDNSLDLPYFSLSVPLKQHRLGFQFNSIASGMVGNERKIAQDDGTYLIEKQEMDRYLYRADLIYSVILGKNQLGVSGNFYFGHEVRTFTQEGDFGLFNTKEELARSYKNPSFTVGILRRFEKLAIGAHYSMGGKLTGEEIRTSIHEEETATDCSYTLPAQISASVTALPVPEFKLATDFHYEPWSSVDADKYEDSWKLGFGAAYEPETGKHAGTFWRLPLRSGISYRHLPFAVNNSDINELALSLGVTIPLAGEANRLDLGLQYTKRGDVESNKLSDDSFMLLFGFTGFDILSKATDRRAPRDIPEKEDIGSW